MKNMIYTVIVLSVLTGCSLSTPKAQVSSDSDQPQMSQEQRDIAASQINVQLGLAYLEQRQIPKAKQKLLLALQQNPHSITAVDATAYFWEVTGNGASADQYYRLAISLNPKSGQALNNYGTFLCRNKHYVAAKNYLLSAASQREYIDSAAALENLGLCELAAKHIEQAEKYFTEALQQDPNRSTSSYELAKLYYQKGDYYSAKQYLKEYDQSASMTSPSLWLGIEIAKKTKDIGTILKNGALLEKHFTNSPEYQLYQKMQLS